jgi:hypothetical protein
MAAHSVTILVEAANVIHWGENERNTYLIALDYAPGMDELVSRDWNLLRRLLSECEDYKLIRDTILVILHTQLEEWIRRNYPDTAEGWADACHE